MRIRSIKPEWLDDELLAAASDEARVLSIALLLMADDYGRGRASLATIAAGAWRYQLERDDGAHAPETLARASRALRELVEMRFVELYEVDRQRYFAIRTWSKHQKVDKPGKPRIPAPSDAESPENPPPRETPPEPSRDSRETSSEASQNTRARSGSGSGSGPRSEGVRALSLLRGEMSAGVTLRDFIRSGVVQGYQTLKLPPPRETRDLTWRGWHELEHWTVAKAGLLSWDQHETARHLIRCFLRSAGAKRRGWPIKFLVENANEYWRDELPAEVA